MSIVKAKNGNFLKNIILACEKPTQYKLQTELQKNQLWERFKRTQLVAEKQSQFDAEIIGIVVQVILPEDRIKEMWRLPDLEKLYVIWAEMQADPNFKLVA